jgi:hypothetical protein
VNQLPPGFRNFTPGQKSISAGEMNQMQKQVREFMGMNFDGRHFQVQGNCISLRQRRADVKFEDHPWKGFQADAHAPGLVVSMLPGLVEGVAETTLNPLNLSVSYTPAAVTDDAVTIFWAKVSLELVAYTTYFKVWVVTAAVVGSGASLPADTLDIAAGTDGDIHVEIFSVTAADGAITAFSQQLFTPLSFNSPLVLVGPSTGKHVLTSEDSVIGWTALGPMTCPGA